jgi:hypothetical protein
VQLQLKVIGPMPLPEDPKSQDLQGAIVLMEEALGILDALGLALVAARLAGAIDVALKAQADYTKP